MSGGHYKSKTLATWIAVIGGGFGLHRFYLSGFRDVWGWLHGVPTLIGLYGVQRMTDFGQDDMHAWALIPLLGFALAAAMRSCLAGVEELGVEVHREGRDFRYALYRGRRPGAPALRRQRCNFDRYHRLRCRK